MTLFPRFSSCQHKYHVKLVPLFICCLVFLTVSEWDLFQQIISLTLLSRFSSRCHKYRVKLALIHSFINDFAFSSHTDCLWCNYQTKLNLITLIISIWIWLLRLMMSSNKHSLINCWVCNEFDQIDEVNVCWSTWLVCLVI